MHSWPGERERRASKEGVASIDCDVLICSRRANETVIFIASRVAAFRSVNFLASSTDVLKIACFERPLRNQTERNHETYRTEPNRYNQMSDEGQGRRTSTLARLLTPPLKKPLQLSLSLGTVSLSTENYGFLPFPPLRDRDRSDGVRCRCAG